MTHATLCIKTGTQPEGEKFMGFFNAKSTKRFAFAPSDFQAMRNMNPGIWHAQ
jgi:hypothetical protein